MPILILGEAGLLHAENLQDALVDANAAIANSKEGVDAYTY